MVGDVRNVTFDGYKDAALCRWVSDNDPIHVILVCDKGLFLLPLSSFPPPLSTYYKPSQDALSHGCVVQDQLAIVANPTFARDGGVAEDNLLNLGSVSSSALVAEAPAVWHNNHTFVKSLGFSRPHFFIASPLSRSLALSLFRSSFPSSSHTHVISCLES